MNSTGELSYGQMTHPMLLSVLFAVAGQIPPPLLVPYKNLSDPGLVADVRDYVVDALGNHYVSSIQSTPTELFFSKDGGRSWRVSPVVPRTVGIVPSSSYAPMSLTVDSENSDILYDCSSRGIFRSNDGGKFWYLLREGPCGQLSIDRGQHNILLAIASGGLIRSIDAGHSWQQIDLKASRSIAQDPSGFGLFAVLSNVGDLSLSRDRGATWTAPSKASFGIDRLAFHPHKPASLYAWNSDRLYRTNDQINWIRLPLPANAFLGEVYPDPQVPGQLWAATGQGLFRTLDDGISWIKVREGHHRWIAGCGAIVAGLSAGAVVSSNGGNDWSPLPFDLSPPAFGAACNGVALVNRVFQGSTKLYAEGPAATDWSRGDSFSRAGGPLVSVRDGFGAVLQSSFNAIRRLGRDGTTLQTYGAGELAIAFDRIASGTDGSSAGSGREITLGGFRIAAKFDALGKRIATALGTLLALDPQNRMVVVSDRGVGIWNDSGKLEQELPLDSGTFALQYLANGDLVAAGWSRPNKIWIARYRDSFQFQMWKTELIGPTARPEGQVRLQIDAGQSAYLEIAARIETRYPLVPQLGAGERSFLKLSRDGEIEWSTMLPGRKFLAVGPGSRLSVIGATPESAQIEILTVPTSRPIRGIDTVLNANATALATAYAGDTLVLMGRDLAPPMAEPSAVRVWVNGVAARVVSASPDSVVIVVPPALNGESAKIELDSPTGPVEPVEIPANN